MSDSALRRICRLSSVSKEGKLEGWLSDSYNYFTRTTTYRLIAPLAACKVLRSRLTLVDLKVGPAINFRYNLAKTIYDTISDDYDLAERGRRLKYEPSNTGIPKQQGILVGTVEKLAEDLIVHEPGKIPRIKSYGEFENDCLMQKKISGKSHGMRLPNYIQDFTQSLILFSGELW